MGPTVAVRWGGLPAIPWRVAGVFFVAWIRDYVPAVTAVRNDGMVAGPGR